MKQVIKDFIEMIEDDFDEWQSDLAICEIGKCGDACRNTNQAYVDAYIKLMESHEYEALKALMLPKKVLEFKRKKQTLLEYMNQFDGNMNLNTPEENIDMISDYLATQYLE